MVAYSREEMPLKKRKIKVQIEDEGEFVIPSTEYNQRKKCAVIDDGLAIKYNKLIANFDKIINFSHFRKYCVVFDIFSKRHLISHCYRIDLLEHLNCYDFTPYCYEHCYCHRPVVSTCTGFLICFKSAFMQRKKYSSHSDNKSQLMKSLYIKHSILHADNNFYDNRINECFRQKIKNFEQLKTILQMEKKILRILHKNMLLAPPDLIICSNCKNLQNTTFPKWRAVHFLNCVNINYLCDYVLKLDSEFLVPSYRDSVIDKDTRIVIYKTTKTNLVLLSDNVFYVLNSSNVLLIFDVDSFRKTQFFCNFNFYFIRLTKTYSLNNYINLTNY